MLLTAAEGVVTTGAMFAEKTPFVDWFIITPVIIPLIGAGLLIMFRRAVILHPYVASAIVVATVYACAQLLLAVHANGPQAMTMGNWFPPFGISFTVDLLGAILTLTSSLAVLAVALYAIGDTSGTERRFGFYPLLLTLLVGVNGSFLTGDIFNLYVWFEVFLISSFGLIVLGGTAKQLDGAVKYCFLNLIATTLFLIATGYLYGVFGTLNMADLSKLARASQFEGPIVIISVLFLVAFSMKAAAFPLYFWLPASYHTPKIIVSALFAGLLTKVGIYALIRTFTIILPITSGTWIFDIMLYVGIITLICGAMGAVVQTDMRRMFAYLLVASIGFMMVGLSIGTQTAIAATLFYMVHSILVMTGLFLVAGLVDHFRGSLDLRELSGVNKDLPLLSFIFLIFVFMASGFPPFTGFWPKLVLISETIRSEAYWGTTAIIFSSFLSIIALGRAYAFGFWRPLEAGAKASVEKSAAKIGPYRKLQYLPVLLLLAVAVAIGLQPSILYDLADKGAKDLLDGSLYIDAVLGGLE